MRQRRLIVAATAIALLALGARHPTASLSLLTADVADRAPHRLEAAADLGLVGVKLLVTWSAHQLR